MARCPFCDEVLSDAWIKRAGATLMGRSGGNNKARNNYAEAAVKRWTVHDELQAARAENERLKQRLRETAVTPRAKPRKKKSP